MNYGNAMTAIPVYGMVSFRNILWYFDQLIYNKITMQKMDEETKKVNSHCSHDLVNCREGHSHEASGADSKFVTSLRPLSLTSVFYSVLFLYSKFTGVLIDIIKQITLLYTS